MYALNENTLEYDTDVLIQGRSSFMVVSQFRSLHLVKNVAPFHDEREEAVRASLFICLNLIFMQNMENGVAEGEPLNKSSMDDGVIASKYQPIQIFSFSIVAQLWTALSRLGFSELLKFYEKDFGKFMKTVSF